MSMNLRGTRIFVLIAMTFILLELVACGGSSSSSTGIVHQVGYSYDPANYGDFKVPVWWQNDEPTVLPTAEGTCSFKTGGVAEAITASGSNIYITGFSTVCNEVEGEEYWSMVPAVWLNGTRTDLKHGAAQAEADSIAVANGNVYVGGGAGVTAPIPVLWTNGEEADLPIPSNADSGIVTKVVVSGSDVYAIGFVHDETTHFFTPGYWKNGVYTEISLGNSSYEVTRPTTIAVSGTDVLAGVNIYNGDPNLDKAALWKNGQILPLTDLNFDTAPWSGVDALLYDGTTSLAAGYITNGNVGFPAPVYWQGTSPTFLSVLDNNINGGSIGEAYDLVRDGTNLYISGYTSYHVDADTVVAVPCYWVNGQRHDRKAITSSSSYNSVAVPTTSPVGWTDYPAQLDFGNNQLISGSLSFTQTVANSAAANGIVVVH
jgi:hypothetical protein